MTKHTTTTTTIACTRCNGVGEYTWMTSQGWTSGTCFRCGGCGIDPNPVQAEKTMTRNAEAQAKREAFLVEFEAAKAVREAQQALDDEVRWARDGVRTINREIAKAEKEGNAVMVNVLEGLRPTVEAKLAAVLAAQGLEA